jgi:predicted small secreted protein
MFIMKKNIFITIGIVAAVAFLAGCRTAGGLGGVLSSETESERAIPAEFKLAKTEGKIAVVVSQPAWIKTPVDLRGTLTDILNLALEEKVKIKKERLFPYTDILELRRNLPDEKKDEPFEIASKLNAQYVLAIQITDFELSTFAEEDLFNGLMKTKSSLFSINSEKLWPQDANEAGREITVGFESEKRTVKSAVEQLSAATAYCITRYLYDCKAIKFRIAEEQKELDFYTW